jgi:hypothetical protein
MKLTQFHLQMALTMALQDPFGPEILVELCGWLEALILARYLSTLIRQFDTGRLLVDSRCLALGVN